MFDYVFYLPVEEILLPVLTSEEKVGEGTAPRGLRTLAPCLLWLE